uniref:procollagen-proline 4-dioxygenase n=1 Tax=Clastoptera arizonana TaxID=38151 RepID=A0A1B6C3U3_9HEMI
MTFFWKKFIKSVFPLLCCISVHCINEGEFFTSIETMEELFDIEVDLLGSLDRYIKEQQRILNLLISRYEEAVQTLYDIKSREKYVSNPINAFSLIRRLTKDWPKTLSLVHNITDIIGENELPGKDEFISAIKAIFRLQDVYKISTEILAKGKLPGVEKYSILTAEDCAEIAFYYYSIHFYELSTQWLLQALLKVEKDKSMQTGYILESLALSTCFEGDQESSTKYMKQLLKTYPYYTPPPELVADFNIALMQNCSQVAAERMKARDPSVPELYPEEIEEYNAMCRAKGRFIPGLRCHYVHYGNPYLLMGPFKVEELHIEPPILLFHDAMSDEEIKHLKNESAPYMTRAQIIMPNGSVRSADYRTSRITWIEDGEDAVAHRISQRVKAMTNLDIEHSEMNQISNYGIAGEYISHSDAIEGINLTTEPTGNRLATFMFYMSDVEQGGHTVFPLLKVSIPPKKRAGVFWFNLHENGTIDYRMRHASCPVVLGSKWVCNKWLHEAGQELKFPCTERESNRQYFYL